MIQKSNDNSNGSGNGNSNDKDKYSARPETGLNFEQKQTRTTVSDIRTWLICPRLFFFNESHREKNKISSESDEFSNHILYQKDPVRFFEAEFLKEICFFLPEMVTAAAQENENGNFLDESKLKKELKQLADDLKEEMTLWTPDENEFSKSVSVKTKSADGLYDADSKNPVWEKTTRQNPNPAFPSAIVAEKTDLGYLAAPEKIKPVFEENASKTPSVFTSSSSSASSAAIDDAYDAAVRRIPKLIQNVSKTIECYGFSLYDAAGNPAAANTSYYYEKLNLSGAPHKIVVLDGKLLPYLIKTSKTPANGIWEKDRIAAAAYVLILENRFGKANVSDNFIADYAGELRVGRVRSDDKKMVLRILRQMKEARNGKMPNERNIRFCSHCPHQEKCRPKLTSFLSRLFE
ncbi:hypothetical protein [Methanolapillus africanus]